MNKFDLVAFELNFEAKLLSKYFDFKESLPNFDFAA